MLSRALFLAARTARSQAYAQAMAAAGITPGHVLVCGTPSPAARAVASGRDGRRRTSDGLVLPDLSEPIEATAAAAGWTTESVAVTDVNDPRIAAHIADLRPSCIIYSGFGGQIVRDGVLSLGVPLLHAHSGWLPRYRGSTTVYYSLLEARECAVSVLVMAREIDAGPVIARAKYPMPSAGTDVDGAWDAAIRADLLVRTLREIERRGALPPALDVSDERARTYYVVHPVLKHLALLSLPADAGRGVLEAAS